MLVPLVRRGKEKGGGREGGSLKTSLSVPDQDRTAPPNLLTTPVFFIAADPVHSLPATVDLQALGSGYNSRIHSSLDKPPDL